MISDKETTRISKFLSLVLRHQPETIGIILEENGWVNVNELIHKINQNGFSITKDILDYVVETNSKKRFAYNEDQSMIRASQGHSVEIDLGYKAEVPPLVLYHGTAETNATSILNDGIQKRNRHHVHLSKDEETARKVGMRHGKPVIFEIAANDMSNKGFIFYVSENGVWLTDFVPPEYLNLKRLS